MLTDRAPAKVNLTLRVLGRRADGYHDLHSLVVFADLADELSLYPAAPFGLDVGGPFAGACGPVEYNFVCRAARGFADAFAVPLAGRFILIKSLPAAAGLGGGSADAAAALRLLARANGIALDDPRLRAAAREVGADVPVCLEPRPRVMQGRGDILSEALELPALHALLVNPGVALATGAVFAAWRAPAERAPPPGGAVPTQWPALLDWLSRERNDLEPAAMRLQSAIADVLAQLRGSAGCRLARMSGSGATCFGLYDTAVAAAAAERALAQARPDWWVRKVVLNPP